MGTDSRELGGGVREGTAPVVESSQAQPERVMASVIQALANLLDMEDPSSITSREIHAIEGYNDRQAAARERCAGVQGDIRSLLDGLCMLPAEDVKYRALMRFAAYTPSDVLPKLHQSGLTEVQIYNIVEAAMAGDSRLTCEHISTYSSLIPHERLVDLLAYGIKASHGECWRNLLDGLKSTDDDPSQGQLFQPQSTPSEPACDNGSAQKLIMGLIDHGVDTLDFLWHFSERDVDKPWVEEVFNALAQKCRLGVIRARKVDHDSYDDGTCGDGHNVYRFPLVFCLDKPWIEGVVRRAVTAAGSPRSRIPVLQSFSAQITREGKRVPEWLNALLAELSKLKVA